MMISKSRIITSGNTLRVRPVTAAVAAILGGTLTVPVALAQGPLEEIVVTASRRETTIQELPFNITAIGGDQLERQRLTRLSDFSRWVPGLTVVDQGGRGGNLMTVRGLNTLSLNASEFLDNSSGDYLGEIPLYVDFKMKDIQRVEALLGPQGTLYGAGTLGGAIRYIPNKPDTREFTIDVGGDMYALSESDGLGYEADLVVNVPIVEDSLAFRASVNYLDDPGFIDYPYLVREPGVSNPQPDFADPADVAANLYGVEDANYEETISTRLALLWNISDNVEATLNYYFQDMEVGARTVNHRDSIGTGQYESGHRFLEPNDRENSLISLEIVADLGFATLTSATGLSNYDELGQRDQTDLLLDFMYGYETFPAFAAFTREDVEEERTNQELRLVSNGDGPVSWIAGLYYNELDVDALSQEFTPGIPEWFGIAPPPLPTGDLEFQQVTQDNLTEQALYGELTFSATDRLSITLGGRYFDYDTEQFIGYAHLPGLGGLRRPAKDSINTGWRNASFRGYADYMNTPPFQDAIEDLIALAARRTTVIMCAEAVFWRCHRALVADALLVRDVDVAHIMDFEKLTPATMTKFAKPEGTQITYPAE